MTIGSVLTLTAFDEKGFDFIGGAALSHFPRISGLESNASWMSHSLAAYGGAHAGAIVESLKFVGKK